MGITALPHTFYEQDTIALAKSLLGKLLVHDSPDGHTSGFIVETEAYKGPMDKAAHSYGGRLTPRTQVMYGEPGYAYVYLIYGLHYCLNVVSGREGAPEAILIRAIEPFEGVALMAARRGLKMDAGARPLPPSKLKLLTNGPGKLAQAMGITKDQYGWNLATSSLSIHPGKKIKTAQISTGTRIGIDYAEEARDYPWRFWLKGNLFVSK